MERLYLFFIRNDVWIYIVCAFGFVWYFGELIRSQRLLRRAMFNLEREAGSRMRNNAFGMIVLFAGLAGVVFYVNRNIAPQLPPELMAPPTPTPNVFSTPLTPPTPIGGASGALGDVPVVPQLAPTVTLPSDAAPQAGVLTNTVPLETPTPFAECLPFLTIAEPRAGSVVSSLFVVRGTADTGEGHLYSVELNGPQTAGAWAALITAPLRQPVVEGELVSANLAQWQSGPYRLRLRATDVLGNEIGQCTIQITLDSR